MRYLGRLAILLGHPRSRAPLGCRVARAAKNCCPNPALQRARPSALNLGCPISKSAVVAELLLRLSAAGHHKQRFMDLVFCGTMVRLVMPMAVELSIWMRVCGCGQPILMRFDGGGPFPWW
jgi:hypothetical protein